MPLRRVSLSLIMWEDFERVDLTVGSVTRVEDFPEAKKGSYKLWMDFGELGTKVKCPDN